ncbi:MAG: aminotransferase class III-fold pyridoxal phosphate-dependent enzyme [Deltaproteobacteria bacterium]|jgi:4-aminobutyrate aminotransferase/(S)-3-amino-2-methylpropionate transaminase|nr:aminotransferase class III-fold pyridoxal phosphate-dependent enzyme [Deltaproteobacteria bacterium]MBW2531335.1 aminotransferase class III-fold pyridoxal phosphate-dependent enzyme [Deltaproteobacteria bacterium]
MSPLSELPGAMTDPGAGQRSPDVRADPPGPLSIAAARRLERVECPAFGRRRRDRAEDRPDHLPIVLASGRGSNVWDVDGNRYVDLVAGFGAVLLGHGAPALTSAVHAQSDRLVQGLGDVYATEVKVALLERLAPLLPCTAPQVLLAQAGGDAVTAAMKTATLATGRPGFIAFDGAYHGLGLGPLPACGLRPSYREPFAAQLNPHVRFAPYPGLDGADVDRSLAAVKQTLQKGDVAAILVEPILGRGGCLVPPDGFLTELCALAHDHQALVIADEVWTGLGRAGALVRSVELGADIDILCLGKGLGGGVAISACIAPESIMEAWSRDAEVIHTSTHCGAPLACAAALATLDGLSRGQLPSRARDVGARVREAWSHELSSLPAVVAVRGEGLMIGVEMSSAATCQRTARKLLGRGYLVLTGGRDGRVLTLTPALTIGEDLLLQFGATLREELEP